MIAAENQVTMASHAQSRKDAKGEVRFFESSKTSDSMLPEPNKIRSKTALAIIHKRAIVGESTMRLESTTSRNAVPIVPMALEYFGNLSSKNPEKLITRHARAESQKRFACPGTKSTVANTKINGPSPIRLPERPSAF